MNKRTFFLVAALDLCLLYKLNAETEPFDRIVLKDMTVIKASLVKEMPDSLAYFELNDTAFVKHHCCARSGVQMDKVNTTSTGFEKSSSACTGFRKSKTSTCHRKKSFRYKRLQRIQRQTKYRWLITN
jgi:hypothetical protein